MSDPTKTPARMPPPGQTSNLHNPLSTGYQQTICNVICLVFVTLFVGLRIYTRIRLVKCVSWDDYLIIFATCIFFITVGLFQAMVSVGLGTHLWNVSASDFAPKFLRLWTFAAMLYSLCMLFIKVSILMLYRRLFPINNFQYLWWACMICTIGYGLGGMFASLFACLPIGATWNLAIQVSSRIDMKAFYIGNGVMNILTDLMILALPIPIVWSLSLELRQKITLSVVFTLGSLSCVISLVRLISIVTWIHVGDTDITYTTQGIVVWSAIELAACIICANIVCLRPFITRHLPFLSISSHQNHHNNASSTNLTTTKYPTTIGGGKRSRSTLKSPYIHETYNNKVVSGGSSEEELSCIFDGTQDIEMGSYNTAGSGLAGMDWKQSLELEFDFIDSSPPTPGGDFLRQQYQAPPQPTAQKQQQGKEKNEGTKDKKEATTTKHTYAKHGYKPSNGNMTIVTVSRANTLNFSTTSHTDNGEEEEEEDSQHQKQRSQSQEESFGASVTRKQSLKSLKSIASRKGRKGRAEQREKSEEKRKEVESRILVQTEIRVQTFTQDAEEVHVK